MAARRPIFAEGGRFQAEYVSVTELKLPNPARPAPYWVFIAAALVWWWQGPRVNGRPRRAT